MKFLQRDNLTAEDKDTGCKVTIKAPTNEVRFALIALYNVEEDKQPDIMAIASLLFTKSLITAEVDGATLDGATLRRADISDEDTATKFFSCVTMCAELVFGTGEEQKK